MKIDCSVLPDFFVKNDIFYKNLINLFTYDLTLREDDIVIVFGYTYYYDYALNDYNLDLDVMFNLDKYHLKLDIGFLNNCYSYIDKLNYFYEYIVFNESESNFEY